MNEGKASGRADAPLTSESQGAVALSKVIEKLPTPIVDRTILLGAGFSKNFGGYLACEFKQILLTEPEIASNNRLKNLVWETPNFENALASARAGTDDLGVKVEDVASLENAIANAYRKQNKLFKNLLGSGPTRAFFSRFGTPKVSNYSHLAAYYFTLNQDTFLERLVVSGDTPCQPAYQLPGVQSMRHYFRTGWPAERDLHESAQVQTERIQVQDDWQNVERIDWRNQCNVIKLHGSAEWRNGDDRLMVVGGDKDNTISQSPLLSTYREVFRAILGRSRMRLLVVGYGFGDPHINRQIMAGLDNRLGLWIWDRMDQGAWAEHMGSGQIHLGQDIRKAAKNYTNVPVAEVLDGLAISPSSFGPVLDDFFSL